MKKDFLRSGSNAALKREIQNYHNSYSHHWDVVAELAQNAVDSIGRSRRILGKSEGHFIKLTINQKTKSIKITDSGTGFPLDRVEALLGPGETDKVDNENAAESGEKGVGLTFCIFCCEEFTLKTVSMQGEYRGTVRNGRSWRLSDDYSDASIPGIEDAILIEEPRAIDKTGTEITLSQVEVAEAHGELSIFNLDVHRLAHLLRTRTAIGRTSRAATIDTPIDVELTIVRSDGTKVSVEVEPTYAHPHYAWDKKDIVDLTEFEKSALPLSDAQRRKKLANKIWVKSGKIAGPSGYEIGFTAVLVPEADSWTAASKAKNLAEFDADGNLTHGEIDKGILVATKGMPTGVSLDPPRVGEAPLLNLFFVLIEYDNFVFDVGRKFIPSRTQWMLKEKVAAIFTDMKKWRYLTREKRGGKTPKPGAVKNQERIQAFEKIESLPDLKLDGISFGKRPDHQEAGVVAIFHELVGAGVLRQYRCLSTGYQQDYDFWGMYDVETQNLGKSVSGTQEGPLPVVIEFKYEASRVIDDTDHATKDLTELDLIVCWEVDVKRFKDSALCVEVAPVEKDEVFFRGTTHVATPSVGEPIPIISLRSLIESWGGKVPNEQTGILFGH